MSTIITEEIVKDIGEAWYTLKVDGTKDPTGCENVSIVLRYVDTSNTVRERLVSMATSKQCDAKSLTQLVLAQLRDIGLNTAKVLSQCYDGASVMSGVHGGMQKIVQEELQREVPYVHCFNHQLHLVVVHAMSSDFTLENFFSVCNSLYKYFKKPTVAAVYTGEKLKRLLEQRWTGHLATVTVILKSFDNIVHLLRGIDSTQTSAAEVRMEATGLLKVITRPSFLFIACMTHQILSLLDPLNTALQANSTDLYTGVRLVQSALACVEKLRCDTQFDTFWEKFSKDRRTTEPAAAAPPQKRPRNMGHLSDYVVDTTVGHRQKRLYFSTLDAVVGEMKARFSVRNSQLVEALCTLHPGSEDFLDANRVRPLLDLTCTEIKEAEFAVAQQFLQDEMAQSNKNWTTQDILTRYCEPLAAMPTVLKTLKLSLTFGASTATCETLTSTLKNVFSEHRRSMLHKRKACLIQIAVEKDLTKKFTGEWKETLLRRFSTASRRLQLF
ncbi:Zinc finger MYM-type protein 1 [Merluccius polli]|uniref:Zinc finger MYM-type protein 1 n=1 Tax=Merluccius polli TaxID=89951 RepID=A0AA47N8D6_MERPO|nr:Zinc finger MYM-type protein 1 [Merluccius polli]